MKKFKLKDEPQSLIELAIRMAIERLVKKAPEGVISNCFERASREVVVKRFSCPTPEENVRVVMRAYALCPVETIQGMIAESKKNGIFNQEYAADGIPCTPIEAAIRLAMVGVIEKFTERSAENAFESACKELSEASEKGINLVAPEALRDSGMKKTLQSYVVSPCQVITVIGIFSWLGKIFRDKEWTTDSD